MPTRSKLRVHAAHDICRGDHTIVRNGSPGRIVYAHPSWFETTYTVKFGHSKEAITMFGLTKEDVQPG